MRKLRCCVIDDEPLALGLIKSYVEQTPFLEFVDGFQSASLGIKTILDGNIDLVFLDIQMAELNGIEFARVIPAHCRIIFITAYQQYAIDGYKVNALDYLLKPVSYSEFLNSANKALKWFEVNDRAVEAVDNENKFIIVKSEYKLIQIDIDKILYIEGLKDYVKIYIEDSPQPVLLLMSLKALETSLPSSRFIRVHRSFIVHTSKIRLIERNRIVFGKQYIPVSETYKDTFMDYINKHSINPTKDDNNNI